MDPAATAVTLSAALGRHARPRPLSYGTAGFRGAASDLPEAVLRCGVLAALRSRALSGRGVGVMVTASHNPPGDNGIKLVEPNGAMLCAEWEELAGSFVNADEQPLSVLGPAVAFVGPAQVFVGRDTRESSPALAERVCEGVRAAGGVVVEIGVVTTPQLHFVVRATDRGEPHALSDYYAMLRDEYASLSAGGPSPVRGIVVDCANGVGAVAMDGIGTVIEGAVVVNKPGNGPLNTSCGADFVQKKRSLPTVYTREPPACRIWASLDGDADRLVLFKRLDDGGLVLADGDRFATLLAMFCAKHVQRSGSSIPSDTTIAVAQTAYSNGAATEFLDSLPGVTVVVAKTGVKHLEKAVKPFDIGIYWEPNGHGTVLFSETFAATVEKASNGDGAKANAEKGESVAILRSIGRLANQAVGDGVADLLLVLAVLSRTGMDFDAWLSMYAERCSSNVVVRVADKTVIETEDCDRGVKSPVALRAAVMQACSVQGRRTFVRPSGTEDVVRVYAEAPAGKDIEACDMAVAIARAVYDSCGGVGERL